MMYGPWLGEFPEQETVHILLKDLRVAVDAAQGVVEISEREFNIYSDSRLVSGVSVSKEPRRYIFHDAVSVTRTL